jgi:hypothetical protein
MPDYDNYPNYSPWYSSRENIKTVVIENGVTGIGEFAFYGCRELTSVTIPNSVITIGTGAFMSSGITTLVIPQSVTDIGYGAFSYCYSLTSVTIPNSVTTIGGHAFFYCRSITNLHLPQSVADIGEGAFACCEHLVEITVEEGNLNYTTFSGVLFNAEKTKLFCYPAGKPETSYIVPDRVTSIEYEAFEECRKLTSISLPNSLTTIGLFAFDNCTGLSQITIPDSVTEIGRCAFWNCTALSYIAIPNSVTRIGNQAFAHCTGLTSIIVYWDNPSQVAFVNGTDLFTGLTPANIKLYVPTGAASKYRSINTWKTFDIKEGSENFNLDLASLTVNHGALYPAFSPFITDYVLSVVNSISSIILTATPIEANSTVSGDGEKSLELGENTFSIIVTAEDGITQKTYTLKVYRLSGESTLEWRDFTDRYTNESHYVAAVDKTLNFNVITGRYLYYTLTTGNVSGNLSLHFDFGNGVTCDRIITVSPYSIYKITLNLTILPDNPRTIITPIDAYGKPGTPYISYKYYPYVITASEGSNIMQLTETEIPGTLTAASISDVTFEGNVSAIKTLDKQKVVVYPNPATDFVTVSCTTGDKITLFNSQGVLLKQQTAQSATETLDIHQYAAGIYYIRVNESAAKIIKR